LNILLFSDETQFYEMVASSLIDACHTYCDICRSRRWSIYVLAL